MSVRSKLLTALSVGLAASAAQASDSLQASLNLRAEVAAFCKVDSSEREVNADGAIGTVVEVCNTPGYSVRAAFANVVSGEVIAGDERTSIAGDGVAIFTSPEARRRVREWQLASAVRANPEAPVLVRFSISPL